MFYVSIDVSREFETLAAGLDFVKQVNQLAAVTGVHINESGRGALLVEPAMAIAESAPAPVKAERGKAKAAAATTPAASNPASAAQPSESAAPAAKPADPSHSEAAAADMMSQIRQVGAAKIKEVAENRAKIQALIAEYADGPEKAVSKIPTAKLGEVLAKMKAL